MNRTDRLYALREELRRAGARGRTADQLAALFEVSARTIKRDVSTLQAGGFPVWARPGRLGGYVVDEAATLPPINLTATEVSGLAAALAASERGPFHAAAEAALVKVLSVMEPGARSRATALAQRVWVDRAEGLEISPGVWRAVERSLAEGRVLRISSVHSAGARETRLDPIVLARTRGEWYLVGRDRAEQTIRWWPVSRIVSAGVLSEAAESIPVETIGTPPSTARTISQQP
ncbi:HTH domain-containing protein (plasmid) [Rathayibacter sp. VKM Ac-2803]|uniref:Transcriptional regulator n=1 Tax=Rathayibacter caricis DSM 15933 TaxID=1328867 RepID=A0A2T4UP58_9MICO|nr:MULTISPECIES: WYL domain-containing protein [Rathayibacter]MWV51466.1 HTH domain-containing protein [Rathayibacter sp. VKM Ac-2803]PTL71291.1 transcriptional regulator [Rathayibacter caricis DSM 15933]